VKKPEKESVQTAIRLPRETYEWLRERPEGITDTIKRGLDFVPVEEKADQPTREFALLIFELTREIELETGAAWHADGPSHRTFRRALLRAISKWRPADYVENPFLEPVAHAPFQERAHATQPINDADELGVSLADMVLQEPNRERRQRWRSAMENTLKEIVRLQQTRGAEGND
jgi:hypothetical protein